MTRQTVGGRSANWSSAANSSRLAAGAGRGRHLLLLVLLVLGCLLAWRVLHTARAGRDDLLQQAERSFTAGDHDRAATLAAAALRLRPLDGRPYRVLARIAQARGDGVQAAQLGALAVQFAPRDTVARAMAADTALRSGEFAQAVWHYDRLLRVDPALAEVTLPVLLRLANEVPAARAALIDVLAARPVWRWRMLLHLAANTADPAQLTPYFRALGGSGGLAPEEMGIYIGGFVAAGRWDEAFIAWANELPPARRQRLASPVNGDFEQDAGSGAPFEWQIAAPAGIEAGMVARDDGKGRALRVAFAGSRVPYDGVRQLLLLQPARRYEMRWQSHLAQLQAEHGLRWVLKCAQAGGAVIFESQAEKGSHPWRASRIAFAVPEGCPAQWLHLELRARVAAEAEAVGAAWFDDLQIGNLP